MGTSGDGFKLSKGMIAMIGVLCCCTFALLIWRQLRMVTGVPRTAYADPHENIVTPKQNQRQAPAQPAPNQPSRFKQTTEKAQKQIEEPAAPSSSDGT